MLAHLIPVKSAPLLAAASLCLGLSAPALAQSNSTQTPPQAEPTRLSPSEARSFALGLLKQGEPAAARALALGLLRKDSRDFLALMVLAEAERALGRPAAAKFAARRAWRSTDKEKERFAAAFTMSNILKGEEKYGQAQIWLRRAGEATSEPRFEHAARREFGRLRAQNPWHITFGFTLAPTSNVNGGPNDNTYTIGDLVFVDPTAVPLSGVEYGVQLGVTRRFAPTDMGRAALGLHYDERRYSLSSASKAEVPSASGSDYAFAALEAKFSYDFASGSETAQTTADLSLTQTWQATSPLSQSYKLRLGRELRGKTFVRSGYGFTYEDLTREDNATRSFKAYTVDGFALRQLENKSLLRFGIALSDVNSRSNDTAHQSASVSLAYLPAKPLFGAQATFSGTLQLREYDRIRYGTTVRRDEKLALTANFVFENIDYMGFSPSLTLKATRNKSNKNFFDTEEFGVSLGIKSTF